MIVGKSGFIQMKAFLEILELHSIRISPADQSKVADTWGKDGGFVKYKEVLHYLTANLDLMNPFDSNWILRKGPAKLGYQKGYSSVTSETKSYVSGATSVMTDATIDYDLKERAKAVVKG
jgi:hypothetical protein